MSNRIPTYIIEPGDEQQDPHLIEPGDEQQDPHLYIFESIPTYYRAGRWAGWFWLIHKNLVTWLDK